MYFKPTALVLIVIGLASLARSEIKISLSDRLANNFTKYLLANVSGQKHIPLPKISQIVPTDFVALNITLDPTFLENITIPSNQTFITFTNTIYVEVANISLGISTEVDIKGGLFSKHQPYNMTVSNLNLICWISFKLIPETSKLAIDKFDVMIVSSGSYVSFSGASLAIISNYVYGYMRTTINTYIEGDITNTIKAAIRSSIESYLDNSQYIVPIPINSSENKTIYLNYTFLNAPSASFGYFVSSFTGEFFLQGDSARKIAIQHTARNNHANDFEMSITDQSLNTLLSALARLGVFNLYIKSEDVPPSPLFNLDTTSLGYFIPGFVTTYGLGKKVDVDIMVDNTTLPSVQTSDRNLTGSFVASLSFIVRKSELEKELALNIKTKVSFTIDLYVQSMKIKGKINAMSLGDFTVVKTAIGKVDTSGLESLSKLVVGLGVPVINNQLSKNGIPIPSIPNVRLDEFNIVLSQNCVAISSDIYFKKEVIA